MAKIKKETVTISKEEYDELLITQEHMNILDALGVDNWEGYVGRCGVETYCYNCGGDTEDCGCKDNE